jgi:hypothetical protein
VNGVRDYLLTLAASGHRVPIGADLVLHKHSDAEDIRQDGPRLGMAVCEAAATYGTPLAIPLMDLRLEKADALQLAGLAVADPDSAHLESALAPEVWSEAVRRACTQPLLPLHSASVESVSFVARQPNLVPFGMAIGPFSLMTKLLKDPITAVALAARGSTAEDDGSVALMESALQLAELAIRRSIRAQTKAGAKAVIICEPAANLVYLSPRQLKRNPGIFDRLVIEPNLRVRGEIHDGGAELVFHDCGELTPGMVEAFGNRIHPAMLSLGSSRKLWDDAPLVPDDVVLFGNLPTKNFYSDSAMPDDRVRELTRELVMSMRAIRHPHILGSECDVLHVDDSAESIRRKVEVMLRLPVS